MTSSRPSRPRQSRPSYGSSSPSTSDADKRMDSESRKKDIVAGKVSDNHNLKISEAQSEKMPPKYEGYYSSEQGSYARESIAKAKKDKGYDFMKREVPEYDKDNYAKKYKKGLVIKISGDYDDALSDRHNEWATITKVIDKYHFQVKTSQSSKPIIIRDTDVKWWVGDKKYDYVGVGKQRWKDEIVPMTRIK